MDAGVDVVEADPELGAGVALPNGRRDRRDAHAHRVVVDHGDVDEGRGRHSCVIHGHRGTNTEVLVVQDLETAHDRSDPGREPDFRRIGHSLRKRDGNDPEIGLLLGVGHAARHRVVETPTFRYLRLAGRDREHRTIVVQNRYGRGGPIGGHRVVVARRHRQGDRAVRLVEFVVVRRHLDCDRLVSGRDDQRAAPGGRRVGDELPETGGDLDGDLQLLGRGPVAAHGEPGRVPLLDGVSPGCRYERQIVVVHREPHLARVSLAVGAPALHGMLVHLHRDRLVGVVDGIVAQGDVGGRGRRIRGKGTAPTLQPVRARLQGHGERTRPIAVAGQDHGDGPGLSLDVGRVRGILQASGYPNVVIRYLDAHRAGGVAHLVLGHVDNSPPTLLNKVDAGDAHGDGAGPALQGGVFPRAYPDGRARPVVHVDGVIAPRPVQTREPQGAERVPRVRAGAAQAEYESVPLDRQFLLRLVEAAIGAADELDGNRPRTVLRPCRRRTEQQQRHGPRQRREPRALPPTARRPG